MKASVSTAGMAPNSVRPFVNAAATCGIVLFAVCLVAAMNAVRPLPFGSTDDGPIYFLPLIKAHTDALLSGHFVAIDWRLGCGWTPWEGFQAGPFYPPYLIANLLSRLLGEPLAVLDISAALHLAFAGLLVYGLTAGRLDPLRRGLWACLAIAQPAPLLIGMNWHNYLTCYPWFLGVMLLLWRAARGYSVWTARNRLALVLLLSGFFLAAHPQMFVIGLALLCGWRLALGCDRNCLRDWLLLGTAAIPVAVPLLFLYHQALLGAPDWFAARGQDDFMLKGAQSLFTWGVGVTVGNLIPSRLFYLWPGVSWTGIGLFFCPMLLISGYRAGRQRNWIGLALLTGLMMVLSAETFPIVSWFSVGPFAGFRWTWKLTIFVAALALGMVLDHSELSVGGRRHQVWLLATVTVFSVLVTLRGVPFDLLPAGTRWPGSSIRTVRDETLALMKAWGVRPGERIAWVGRRSIHMRTIPAPLLGLMGNAPLLVGLGSAHLYEPLENGRAARAHEGYSTPWRITLDTAAYAADPDQHDRRFAEMGVTLLVSPDEKAFPTAERHVYRDAHGVPVYGKRLPLLQEGVAFPWGIARDGRMIEFVVEPGGELRTAESLFEPPAVPVGRPLAWKQLSSGHWRGMARLVDRSWFIAEALALALAALLLGPRRRWDQLWT